MSSSDGGLRTARKMTEREMIQDALQRNRFNRLSTARELGIHKSTLFRKIKILSISLPEQDGRSI